MVGKVRRTLIGKWEIINLEMLMWDKCLITRTLFPRKDVLRDYEMVVIMIYNIILCFQDGW